MTRFTRSLTLLTFLLFTLCSAALSAANVTGIIKDIDSGEPMMEAAVKLLAAKDSAFVAGVTTDIDGKFPAVNHICE